MSKYKGSPVMVFERQQLAALSSQGTATGQMYNAIEVQVLVSGTTPSATVRLLGGPTPGGPMLPLSDSESTQTGVTGNLLFNSVVGAPYVFVSLSQVTGTYAAGEGWTVILTPYLSPGSGKLSLKMAG